MSLISLILILALAGFLVWLVTTYVPMPPQFKTLILWGSIFIAVLWLLSIFGLLGDITSIRVGPAN